MKGLQNMKVLIIIPAYNEELNIVAIVDKVKKICPNYDLIIVNDGSSDNTAAICKEHEYPLITLPINLGLAGAFQTGMRYAFEKDYDAAIQIDGDGQHDPAYISPMIDKMVNDHADVIIGSRYITERKPHTMRTFGSSLISSAILFTTHQYLGDPTSGMRLFNRDMIEILANNINFGPEPDTIAFLIRKGAKVEEVQVTMHERSAGVSYLTPFRSVRYMINMFISILLVQFFRR